jgi:hypothetical protein
LVSIYSVLAPLYVKTIFDSHRYLAYVVEFARNSGTDRKLVRRVRQARSLSSRPDEDENRLGGDDDFDAAALEFLDVLVADPIVGNERMDDVEGPQPGEGRAVDLGRIGDEVDVRGRPDHGLLELQVGKARIGQSGFDRDAGGRQKQLAREDVAEIVDRFITAE